MRVNEAGARLEKRRAATGTPAFREALRKARGGEAPEPESTPGDAGPPPPSRRSVADREYGVLEERRGRLRGEERSAATAPPRGESRGEPTPAELQAVLRALPVRVGASRVREGEPLYLSFGRALDVEIRPATGGVEIVLRPAPRLARATAAELPAVVAALRAKGIAVARAEVRVRGAPAQPVPPR